MENLSREELLAALAAKEEEARQKEAALAAALEELNQQKRQKQDFDEGTEPFEDVIHELLATVEFPDPATITLERLTDAHFPNGGNAFTQAIVRSGQFVVPRSDGQPYLLLDGWDAALSETDQKQVDALFKASFENPTVVFGASGMGKTRFLLQTLKSYYGSFLVYRKPGRESQNAGSYDLGRIADAIKKAADQRESPGDKRRIADFGIRSLLATRVAFLRQWQAAKGMVTPRQWVLAQLHPEVFFPSSSGPFDDVFSELSVAVFVRCSLKSVAKYRTAGDYLTLVDEAQELQQILVNELAAHNGARPESRRGLFSSVATETIELGGRFPCFSGTGLSMATALKAAESGVGKRPGKSFDHFAPFLEPEVTAYLSRVAGIVDPPLALCKILVGRPRILTRFVERLASEGGSALDVLTRYVQAMTLPPGEPRMTLAGIVSTLRNDLRLAQNKFTVRDPRARPLGPSIIPPTHNQIECTSLFETLKMACFDASNGSAGVVNEAAAKLLVEAGVLIDWTQDRTGLVPMRFEPLMHIAMREDVFTDEFLESRMLAVANEASSLGFAFERVVGCRIANGLFKGDIPFAAHPAIAPHKRRLPKWLRKDSAKLLAFPQQLGLVAERGNDMCTWFERHLALARSPPDTSEPWCVMGKYPGKFAGPDFCMLVRLQRTDMADVIALVLVQVKLTKTLDSKALNAAKATVDPALAYHINRTKKPTPIASRADAHKKWLELLMDVPVVRVVVAAGSSGTTEVHKVKHGRKGAVFKKDALVVLRGEATMKVVFGERLGHDIAELKTDLEDEEPRDYDDGVESQDIDVSM